MRITETETESEWTEVKETETVEKIQCDVCECSWEEDDDEIEIHEFTIDPDFQREYHSIHELAELFQTYYVWVDIAMVADVDDPRTIKTPREEFIEAIDKEFSIRQDGAIYGPRSPSHAEKYVNGIGTLNFYIDGDRIHHFMYEIDLDTTSDELKHVCDDCYEAVFES